MPSRELAADGCIGGYHCVSSQGTQDLATTGKAVESTAFWKLCEMGSGNLKLMILLNSNLTNPVSAPIDFLYLARYVEAVRQFEGSVKGLFTLKVNE